MKVGYSTESRVTSIYVDGAFWGIAVMTGARFEWEVHQWMGRGLTLVTVLAGTGSFDEVLNAYLRAGKEKPA